VDAAFVLAVVAILAFAFTNGFHDAPTPSRCWVATRGARPAVKAQRRLERVYRQAASALLEVQDLREVMGRRELYRRVSRISEILIEAADRVWYATVKEG
jgi:glutamine synthetase adenylyltransferase